MTAKRPMVVKDGLMQELQDTDGLTIGDFLAIGGDFQDFGRLEIVDNAYTGDFNLLYLEQDDSNLAFVEFYNLATGADFFVNSTVGGDLEVGSYLEALGWIQLAASGTVSITGIPADIAHLEINDGGFALANLEYLLVDDENVKHIRMDNTAGTREAFLFLDDSDLFQIVSDAGDVNGIAMDMGAGRVAIHDGAVPGTIGAMLHISSTDTVKAIPSLQMTQADVDQPFIKYHSTSDTNSDRALVDAVDFTTPGTIQGWTKIEVQDDQGTNPIVDGDYYVPFYSAPTA